MVVVAGNDGDLSAVERRGELLKEGLDEIEQLGHRALAKLDHVAEENDSLRALEPLDEPLQRPGLARHVAAAHGA